MPTRHDKLVRDRIPEIMDAAAVRYETRTLDAAAFRRALRAKLVEEAGEAAEAETPDALALELADLLEVMHALMDASGVDADDVERVRHRRRNERGAFERRTWFSTTDP